MSHVEAQFYRVLHDMFGRSYEIFPQIHLSALFDYPDGMHGSRNRQLDLINKWSVDYLICDSKSLQPIVAIELDDYTHDFPERRWRDREVERIFREGKIPLVRFADIQTLSSEDILSGLASHLPNHGPS